MNANDPIVICERLKTIFPAQCRIFPKFDLKDSQLEFVVIAEEGLLVLNTQHGLGTALPSADATQKRANLTEVLQIYQNQIQALVDFICEPKLAQSVFGQARLGRLVRLQPLFLVADEVQLHKELALNLPILRWQQLNGWLQEWQAGFSPKQNLALTATERQRLYAAMERANLALPIQPSPKPDWAPDGFDEDTPVNRPHHKLPPSTTHPALNQAPPTTAKPEPKQTQNRLEKFLQTEIPLPNLAKIGKAFTNSITMLAEIPKSTEDGIKNILESPLYRGNKELKIETVQIALEDHLEKARLTLGEDVIVPNKFLVILAESDFNRYTAVLDKLQAHYYNWVKKLINARGYQTVGRLQMRVESSSACAPATVEVQVLFENTPETPMEATQPEHGWLEVLINGQAVQKYFLKEGINRFGRSQDNHLPLQNPPSRPITVSRTHGEIEVRRGSCLLRDLNSKYGILCNGNSLSSTEHPLQDGDKIAIGPLPKTQQADICLLYHCQ